MDLFLSQDEQQQLEDLSDKCDWARLLWSITMPTNSVAHFIVDRADAWAWKDVVDSTKGFLPRASGSLRTKLTRFYERIS